jgi:hypothetical protein
MAQQLPQANQQELNQYKTLIKQNIQQLNLNEDEVDDLITFFTHVLSNPNEYSEILKEAISEGVIEQGDLPDQFDGKLLGTILMVLKEIKNQNEENPKALKKGGLAKAAKMVAASGRNGDTMLAHINPKEAEMLRRMGGSGTINPKTGLPEFFFKKLGKLVKGAVKAVVGVAKTILSSPIGAILAPIALNIAFPGLGAAIGGALGASGATAAAIGQGVIGAGMSALSGGNPLTGALSGAIGGFGSAGGFGDLLPAGVTSGMAESTKGLLNNAVAGGLASAATGKNPLTGAITAGLTKYGSNYLKDNNMLGDSGSTLNKIATAAAAGAEQGTMRGGGIAESLIAGGMGGAANLALQSFNQPDWVKNLTTQPASTAQQNIQNSLLPGTQQALTPIDYNILKPTPMLPDATAQAVDPQGQAGGTGIGVGQNPPLANVASGTSGATNTGQGVSVPIDFNAVQNNPQLGGGTSGGFLSNVANSAKNMGTGDLLKYGAMALTLGSAASPPAQAPFQQIQAGSPDERKLKDMLGNIPPAQLQYLQQTNQLGAWLAQNWGRIPTSYASDQALPVKAATGGFLSAVALAHGGGSGRDDTIAARLSDGEYVMDAETVALLGDGSADEGARRLDQMRVNLRKQKGKALARGKFSPNAKSPLAYIGGKK